MFLETVDEGLGLRRADEYVGIHTVTRTVSELFTGAGSAQQGGVNRRTLDVQHVQLVEVRKGLRRGMGELDTRGQRQFLLHPWGRLPVSYRFLGVTLLGFWLVRPH